MQKNYSAILLMLFCSLCLCIGSLIWKLMPGYNLIYLFAGFAVYITGAMAMIIAYRYGELSVLQPMNSMSYVFSTLIAVFILNEKIPLVNFIGILLILSGVIVIGTSKQ